MADRLISESKLIEDLYKYWDGFDFNLNDVINVIKSVESIDAVPIVRCKDCQYACDFFHNGGVVCHKPKDKKYHYDEPDWFCADAKRKVDEQQ